MPTLVTGATGLLGNNLVRALLSRGQAVRALVRNTSDSRPLADLDVEIVRGDVRDAAAVRRAVDGVEAVIHSAAIVYFGWSRLDLARAINVDGTRHVAEAALATGARMIHVSTVDTLAPGSPNQPADEETPGRKVNCSYVVSKREGEAQVLELADRGLDAVVVHPGFMLGPWDWAPSSGRMLLEVAKRFTPLAPIGGVSLCDVRDVAAGIFAALQQGQRGRRYILAGHNISYFDAWKMFASLSGRRGPRFRAGPLMRIVAGAAGDVWGKISRREGDVNSAAIRMSNIFHYYRSTRAATELGYRNRPLAETVDDTWQWFQEHGYA